MKRFRKGGTKAVQVASSMVDGIPADATISGSYSLIAGQTQDVGRVVIAKNASNLYIKVQADDSYLIAETHIYVGPIDLLPVNKKGNPVIGHFPYSSETYPGMEYIVHEIPLDEVNGAGCNADVAVHAVVTNEEGTYNETAWGTGNEIQGKITFTLKAVVADPWGYSQIVGTMGTLFEGCTSYLWGSYTIDLSNFSETTYELMSIYNGTAQYGYMDVTLEDGVLRFAVNSLGETVKVSYLFAGSDEELSSYAASGCPDYNMFPMINMEEAPQHIYDLIVGNATESDGEYTVYEKATRWTYYIQSVNVCN